MKIDAFEQECIAVLRAAYDRIIKIMPRVEGHSTEELLTLFHHHVAEEANDVALVKRNEHQMDKAVIAPKTPRQLLEQRREARRIHGPPPPDPTN